VNLRLNGIEPAHLSWTEADRVVRFLVCAGRAVPWEQFAGARQAAAGRMPPPLPLG
jgi:hypothetical protein